MNARFKIATLSIHLERKKSETRENLLVKFVVECEELNLVNSNIDIKENFEW